MQLATVTKDGQPRVSSVYFVAHDGSNKAVYWLSEPDRRHSVAIQNDNRVAGTVVVKTDHPVIGLQFTGTAIDITDPDEVKMVISQYNVKYDGDASHFYKRFQAGTNKHSLYKMTIINLELFDEVHFPDESPIVVPLN